MAILIEPGGLPICTHSKGCRPEIIPEIISN